MIDKVLDRLVELITAFKTLYSYTSMSIYRTEPPRALRHDELPLIFFTVEGGSVSGEAGGQALVSQTIAINVFVTPQTYDKESTNAKGSGGYDTAITLLTRLIDYFSLRQLLQSDAGAILNGVARVSHAHEGINIATIGNTEYYVVKYNLNVTYRSKWR